MKVVLINTLPAFCHQHLDTYLVENKSMEIREFTTFDIDPHGAIVSLNFLGQMFQRVEDEPL